MKDCPFCNLEKIKLTADLGNVVVFEPLNPVVKGHLLVVPKRHVSDFAEDQHVTAEVMAVAANIASIKGGSFNLITSKGKEATQSVMHLHVHLVPRSEGDGLKLPWSDQIKP